MMSTEMKIGFSEVVTVQRGPFGEPEVVSEVSATGKFGRGLTTPVLHFEDPRPALDLPKVMITPIKPDPNVVGLQFPIGIRDFFQQEDLPPGVTYAQIEQDLGMSKETLTEHALLAWPHYVKNVEGAGGSDEEFYERVVEYFYDDIGQEDAKLPMEAHQEALSKHASSLVRMVERIDERLSDFVGGDLFFRQNPPDLATLVSLGENRCVLNLIYPSDDPNRELPFFGRDDGDPGELKKGNRYLVKVGDPIKPMAPGEGEYWHEQLKNLVGGERVTLFSDVFFSDVLLIQPPPQPVREFLERWTGEVAAFKPT